MLMMLKKMMLLISTEKNTSEVFHVIFIKASANRNVLIDFELFQQL
jgi:hypothetical protein